jgi:hypothetical protein
MRTKCLQSVHAAKFFCTVRLADNITGFAFSNDYFALPEMENAVNLFRVNRSRDSCLPPQVTPSQYVAAPTNGVGVD